MPIRSYFDFSDLMALILAQMGDVEVDSPADKDGDKDKDGPKAKDKARLKRPAKVRSVSFVLFWHVLDFS